MILFTLKAKVVRMWGTKAMSVQRTMMARASSLSFRFFCVYFAGIFKSLCKKLLCINIKVGFCFYFYLSCLS